MSSPNLLTGEIFEDYAVLAIGDLSRLCAVDERCIVDLVQEGVLEVTGGARTEWQFSGASLQRARIALRLQRDLELNLPGVALVLELMGQLEQLRRELERRR